MKIFTTKTFGEYPYNVGAIYYVTRIYLHRCEVLSKRTVGDVVYVTWKRL